MMATFQDRERCVHVRRLAVHVCGPVVTMIVHYGSAVVHSYLSALVFMFLNVCVLHNYASAHALCLC